MALNPKAAWMERYRPEVVSDMVWSDDETKNIVLNWFENNKIDGNILLSGKGGTGKSTLVSIIIKHFIKAQNDLYKMKSRSVKEIDEFIRPFLKKRPVKSPFKIVYIEEFDRMSLDAQKELKDGYMEKYIDHCIFIGCTNHPNKLEQALLTRFNYKFDFSDSANIQGIAQRIEFVLNSEGAKFDSTALNTFISNNYKLGMRELINLFQINFNANGGVINFDTLNTSAQFDENVAKLILVIIDMCLKIPDSRTRALCASRPMNTPISEQYTQLTTILINNYFDINFTVIFEKLYHAINYLPLKNIVGRYSQNVDAQKFPQYHMISCLTDMLKCCSEALL